MYNVLLYYRWLEVQVFMSVSLTDMCIYMMLFFWYSLYDHLKIRKRKKKELLTAFLS